MSKKESSVLFFSVRPLKMFFGCFVDFYALALFLIASFNGLRIANKRRRVAAAVAAVAAADYSETGNSATIQVLIK